ncbi:hypothetical protein I4U23_006031 [Adineta vaga]|nr:hypothetical protein I4U23_006031 [Adineta vaga]
MATIRQPGMPLNASNPFFQPTVEWGHGLCDCCSDGKECVYAYFCGCCFMHELGKKMNEESACGGCCVPSRLAVYRMRMRSILHIRGTAMDDCCKASWCGLCTAVQMKLELKDRNLA